MTSFKWGAACLSGIVDCMARHAEPHVAHDGGQSAGPLHRYIPSAMPIFAALDIEPRSTCSASNRRVRCRLAAAAVTIGEVDDSSAYSTFCNS